MPSTPSSGTTGSERTSTGTLSSSTSRSQAIFSEIGRELLEVFDDLVEAVDPPQSESKHGENSLTKRYATSTKPIAGASTSRSKKPIPPTNKALKAHDHPQLPVRNEPLKASAEAPKDSHIGTGSASAGSLPLPLRPPKIDDWPKGKDQITAWLEETDTTVQAPPIPPKSRRRQAARQDKRERPVKDVYPFQLYHSSFSKDEKSSPPRIENLPEESSQHTISRIDKPLPPTPTSQYSIDQNDAEPLTDQEGPEDGDNKHTLQLTSPAAVYRTLIANAEASTYTDTIVETIISYLPPGAPRLPQLPSPAISPTTPSRFYPPLVPSALLSRKGEALSPTEVPSTSRSHNRSASSAGAPSAWPAPKIQRLLSAVQPRAGAVS